MLAKKFLPSYVRKLFFLSAGNCRIPAIYVFRLIGHVTRDEPGYFFYGVYTCVVRIFCVVDSKRCTLPLISSISWFTY
jgi:hypothetical protein